MVNEFEKYFDAYAIVNIYFEKIREYLTDNGKLAEKYFWDSWENRSLCEQYIKDLVLDNKDHEEIHQLVLDMKKEKNIVNTILAPNKYLKKMKVLGSFSDFVCKNIDRSHFEEYHLDGQDSVFFEMEHGMSIDYCYNIMSGIFYSFNDNFGSPNPITPPESN